MARTPSFRLGAGLDVYVSRRRKSELYDFTIRGERLTYTALLYPAEADRLVETGRQFLAALEKAVKRDDARRSREVARG